jgi:signal transduction histidine kinase
VSHEFRTPLAVIRVASELLDRYGERMTAAERHRRIRRIQEGVGTMTGLLEDVITIGRIDAGRLPFTPEPVAVDALCREVLADVAQATHRSEDILLSLRGASAPVCADPRLLRQILSNLIGNAAKYSPGGTPILVSVAADDDTLEVSVADQGIGISPDDQARVLEAFERGTNVGTTPGTGLGLAITRRAVALHGGTLALDSALGAGTRVTVRVPVSTPDAPVDPCAPNDPDRSRTSRSPAPVP